MENFIFLCSVNVSDKLIITKCTVLYLKTKYTALLTTDFSVICRLETTLNVFGFRNYILKKLKFSPNFMDL